VEKGRVWVGWAVDEGRVGGWVQGCGEGTSRGGVGCGEGMSWGGGGGEWKIGVGGGALSPWRLGWGRGGMLVPSEFY
jgi:hypothetical protein